MQDCSVKNVISGVYLILFPNEKKYIGISNNIYRRMLEHNSDFRNNLPIEHAIKKYGKITEFYLLEEIPSEERTLMREREKYYINFYHSNDKDCGYNISAGGDGADSGSLNHEAKFTEEEIQAIYEDLKEEKLSIQEIADKYGVHMTTMSNINNGNRYYHSSVTYPIRTKKVSNMGTKNHNSNISEETLEIIYDKLREGKKSMRKIAEEMGLSPSIIQNINSGQTYHRDNLKYPIYTAKTGRKKLSQEQVQKIIFEIKNTKKSLNQIGRELNIPGKTISSINCGIIYRQENENYPIRKK